MPETTTPETPAAPAAAAAHHNAFLEQLAKLLPLLHHLGAFVVKAAPVVIEAGVHVSPQAQEAIAIVGAISALHDQLNPPTAEPVATPTPAPNADSAPEASPAS